MARSTHCACTSILVGKAASLDGSTLIARTEDNSNACAPKRFTVIPEKKHAGGMFVSASNGFSMPLHGKGLRYTAMPDATPDEGLYEEAGINSAGVAMSATESTYANDRVLAFDPLVDDGLAEDSLLTVALPFITSAREGVERIGDIVAEHGSAESNSVLLSDAKEVWYMELATGHHWIAQRIPDDAYAVCGNRISIQDVDFTSDDFMASANIKTFVDEHHLNPLPDTFNFRRIFGTYSQQDIHYNTPRVWFAQRYLSPEIEQHPENLELPFICRANRLIGVDDVAYLLSSHFEGTEFDPLGSDGTESTRTRYRAMSLSRTQEGHILQLRPDLPAERAGIHWAAMATTAFSPFVPFYANASTGHAAWEKADGRPAADSAYWLLRTLGMLAETRYALTASTMGDFLATCRQKALIFVEQTDRDCARLSGKELTDALTRANQTFLDEILANISTTLQDLIMTSAEDSRLSFTMDENL